MPLAIVSFSVTYVAMFATAQWFEPAGDDAWAALGYFVGLMFLGAVLVVAVIPAVVFTLGRALDGATRDWTTGRAALAFGGAGLGLGLALASAVSWWGNVSLAGAIANVAVPAAVGGLVTRLVLPAALEHRWVSVLSWVLAAIPAAGTVALAIALTSA